LNISGFGIKNRGKGTQMVTLVEIEAAIEKLQPAEYHELLAWIAEHQALVGASEALFALYDDEEHADAEGPSR
jgi:hypothetical protein